jgi:glycosyltransferase involved in cell wall biosynthesis
MNKERLYFFVNSLEAWWAERVIVNLAKRLSAEYEVDIITLKESVFYEVPVGVRHISLSSTDSNIVMLFLFPYYIFQLRKMFRTNNYISWVSSLEIANFIHILSRKNANICFETNIDFFTGFIGNIYKLLIRLLYPLSWKIKVNSEENRFSLSKFLNIPISRIHCVYNPIDIWLLQSHTIDPTIKNNIVNFQRGDQKIFVTVWRLIWQKQHIRILTGFLKLKNYWHDFLYLIIWDGPERKNLEKCVKENNLEENVKFLWTQKDVYSFLKLSDYFVYASMIEWFPNVLVEAIATGLPIITSDFKTGAREAILGEYQAHLGTPYPVRWSNGYLLSTEYFEEDFCNLILKSSLENTHNLQVWLENFDIENSIEIFKKHFL